MSTIEAEPEPRPISEHIICATEAVQRGLIAHGFAVSRAAAVLCGVLGLTLRQATDDESAMR